METIRKGTVCLTFDFDAVSLWIQREMTTMSSLSRGEFGVTAVPRILHMLKKRNLPSTWFIPGHTIETYPDVCRMIRDDGHEIALHGYAHENFNALSAEEEWEVLKRSYAVAESFTGEKPKGFRSPSWDISSRTIENLERLGIVYDSSQMAQDYAVYMSRKGDVATKDKPLAFGETSRIVEIPVAWSLDDYPYFEFLRTPTALFPGLKNPRHVFENWTADIDYMLRDFDDGVAVVTFHPQVSGRGHRLLALERWIDELIAKGLAFSRMDRIAEQFLEGRRFGVYRPE